MDLIAVLTELESQEETSLALKVFQVIQKQDWYKPDVYVYKDSIIALVRSRKIDEAMKLWESMRKEDQFPDSQTYAEMIQAFLGDGSPADAMNIFEDMIKSGSARGFAIQDFVEGASASPSFEEQSQERFWGGLIPENHTRRNFWQILRFA